MAQTGGSLPLSQCMIESELKNLEKITLTMHKMKDGGNDPTAKT